ncbi:MAG: hypothetical protein IIU76_00745 [Bacteroidales bacterium]|nr:hypothetical protein [Bacteroidales bacterium]
MDKAQVYYTNLSTRPGLNLPKKLKNLIKAAGIEKIDFKDKFTKKVCHRP